MSQPSRMPSRSRISWKSILLFLSILGPGIITANVGNDASGITTYSLAGARFGYGFLWLLVPLTIALIFIQEMAARMGAVTGRGLAQLIRETYGVRITLLIMAGLVITNIANTIAEFAGIAAATEIVGVSRFISVPLAALAVWLLVTKGNYNKVEKVFLVACTFYIVYYFAAFLAHPIWPEVAKAAVVPKITITAPYLLMFIALVGTTIAPWMQFYLQSSIVEKGIDMRKYRYSRWDVIIGSIITDITAFFIVVVCAATLFKAGIPVETASDVALSLAPIAGQYAAWLFAFGLFNAAMFAAVVLPLSTTYYVCEAFGWESGLNKKIRDAPFFYSFFTIMILIGAAFVLIPNIHLIQLMVISQAVNGVLLPLVLVAMLFLVNNRSLMGQHVNPAWLNIAAWAFTGIIIIASLLLGLVTLFPESAEYIATAIM